jgi:hypothetical protein
MKQLRQKKLIEPRDQNWLLFPDVEGLRALLPGGGGAGT